MAKTPRGNPRTVRDTGAERRDWETAKVEAQLHAKTRSGGSATDTSPDGRIRHPSVLESFIPVVGPAWDAAADFQDGDYAGAAFNATMAGLDLVPSAVVVKGLRSAAKGVGVLKTGSISANAAGKALRARGLAGPGEEIHHAVRLNGKSRTAQDWRNHYAFLKVLPKEQHRRLTGSWQGKPRYDPVRRVWYGTTDWMKAAPAGAAEKLGDFWENVTQPFPGDEPPRRR